MLKLFRIFQGCFTVQLSRSFAVVLISSNFYIISLLLKFVNNFFIYFSIFRLKLCVSCCLCQTASLYYHPFQHLSTVFFIFLQKRAGGLLFISCRSIYNGHPPSLKMSKSIKSVVMQLVFLLNPSLEIQKSIKSVVMQLVFLLNPSPEIQKSIKSAVMQLVFLLNPSPEIQKSIKSVVM